MDNIKEIHFNFENCEGVIIPFECFKKFEFTETRKPTKDELGLITHLNCKIKDNGKCEYCYTCDNMTSPIQRLSEYNDITHMDIIYNDDTSDEYRIEWYYEDEYDNPQENINQRNNLISYNELHIIIKPYIPSYHIYEIFNLPVNTILRAEDDSEYIVLSDGDDVKYLAQNNKTQSYVFLDETHIKMKYIVIK